MELIETSQSTPDVVPDSQPPEPATGLTDMIEEPSNENPPSPKVPPDKVKSWKDIVKPTEEDRMILSEAFLEGKIDVILPDGERAEPVITISNNVLEVLADVWTSSLVIKVLGTMVPYPVMDRKMRDLWKPGKMRLIDLLNGYYLTKFDQEEGYTKVLTGGP
ncbi:hypothetical protein V2J09_008104 [Rumex salicifolius]